MTMKLWKIRFGAGIVTHSRFVVAKDAAAAHNKWKKGPDPKKYVKAKIVSITLESDKAVIV